MHTSRLDMRADPAFLKAIDDWRRLEADIPTRTEAVRRLVLRGLEASGKAVQPQGGRELVGQPAPAARPPKSASRESDASASQAILATVGDRPWREQRGALRRAIGAHPGWEVIRERDGLNVANLSSKANFRPICAELGLRVPSLNE